MPYVYIESYFKTSTTKFNDYSNEGRKPHDYLVTVEWVGFKGKGLKLYFSAHWLAL